MQLVKIRCNRRKEQLEITLLLFFSLRETYGRVFSLKLGSYKLVMASTSEAVKEMLVTKSADFAGRPQTYANVTAKLGKSELYALVDRKILMTFAIHRHVICNIA